LFVFDEINLLSLRFNPLKLKNNLSETGILSSLNKVKTLMPFDNFSKGTFKDIVTLSSKFIGISSMFLPSCKISLYLLFLINAFVYLLPKIDNIA